MTHTLTPTLRRALALLALRPSRPITLAGPKWSHPGERA